MNNPKKDSQALSPLKKTPLFQQHGHVGSSKQAPTCFSTPAIVSESNTPQDTKGPRRPITALHLIRGVWPGKSAGVYIFFLNELTNQLVTVHLIHSSSRRSETVSRLLFSKQQESDFYWLFIGSILNLSHCVFVCVCVRVLRTCERPIIDLLPRPEAATLISRFVSSLSSSARSKNQ